MPVALTCSATDYTPCEAREVTGWPILTMVRGQIVTCDGELVGTRGHGSYLPRKRSSQVASAPYVPKYLITDHAGPD